VRVCAVEEREVGENHEAFDMVRVSGAPDAFDCGPETVHICVTVVVGGRKRTRRAEGVRLVYLVCVAAVDVSHVLTPSDHLAHKSLDAVQRRFAVVVSFDGAFDSLVGTQ